MNRPVGQPVQLTAEWIDGLLRTSRELAVIHVLPDETIGGWLGASEVVFGYTGDEIAGRPLADLFTPADRQSRMPEHEFAVARETGRSEDDRWHLRKDGTLFWASGVLIRHSDDAGKLLGYFKLVRDRTDLRARQEAMRNRLEALTQQVARLQEARLTLVHELRNPLASLVNAVSMLQQSSEPAQQAAAFDLAHRQLRVVKRLLDDAAVERDDRVPEHLDIAPQVLQQIVDTVMLGFEPQARAKGQSLRWFASDVPIVIEADAERLQQMLLNLVSNALKYTPAGGHITVSTSVSDDMAVIKVDDDGAGIAPENVMRIFDLFTREGDAASSEPMPEGFGIGLAVVKRLAALHGGFVEARSSGKGKGSQFVLVLPLRHAPA